MQTFLPFADFDESARSLDQKRLGKQRVETLQIMHALFEPDYGWQSHPVTKMWRGHAGALLGYQEAVCAEWARRGYNDTCLYKTLVLYFRHNRFRYVSRPDWFGLEELHISHQSNLIRKDPEYYGPQFPTVPGDLPYLWPEE